MSHTVTSRHSDLFYFSTILNLLEDGQCIVEGTVTPRVIRGESMLLVD